MELTLPREVLVPMVVPLRGAGPVACHAVRAYWQLLHQTQLAPVSQNICLSADPKAWCSLRKNSSNVPWKDLVISSDTTCYAHCDEAMHSKTERHASTRDPIAIKLLGRLTRRRRPNNSLGKAPMTAHNLSKSKASTVSSLFWGSNQNGTQYMHRSTMMYVVCMYCIYNEYTV